MRRRYMSAAVLALGIVYLLAACSPTAGESVATPLPSVETADPQPTPTEEETMEETKSNQPHADQPDIVLQALDDLAQRLGIETAAITVVSLEERTWRDGSLGCPQPGMMYTQALVDGSLIKLETNGEIYNYHSGRGRPPFLCQNQGPADNTPPSSDLDK